MRKTLFFMLLFSIAINAQNHRFVYEYTFVKDSLHHEITEKELMNLDITPAKSFFYSSVNAKADSTLASKKNNSPKDLAGITFGKVGDVIEKQYPDYSTTQISKIGPTDVYKLKDERSAVWRILPEKSVIENFKVQRAETQLYGRKWKAWFTTDLPFTDGPYKFHGLPGLIVQIEDATKSHVFSLKAVQKLPKDYQVYNGINNPNTIKNIIPVNYEKYKKAFITNRENPNLSIKQHIAAGGKVMMVDENGKPMDIEQFLKDEDRQVKEKNAKDNNLLELDILK